MSDELMIIDEDAKQHTQIQAHRSILDLPPAKMVAQVSIMANLLSDIIEKQKMFQNFNGKKYVTVDGWCTLGTMLGILPSEKEVHETSNGWYAKVDLVSKNSGLVVGSASAICGRDEKSWKDRPSYAVRSMAVTRATGKAYRLAFSWIMNLSGYMSTPAEEMPIEDENESRHTHARPIAAPTEKKKVIFDEKNHAHIDKLEKVLNEKDIPARDHILIAEKLQGKEFNKANVDQIIEDVKSIPIDIPF